MPKIEDFRLNCGIHQGNFKKRVQEATNNDLSPILKFPEDVFGLKTSFDFLDD